MQLILRCEKEMQSSLPRGEILSRGWLRFQRIRPKNSEHALRLVRRICHHVMAEYYREQERAQRLYVFGLEIDFPSLDAGLGQSIEERFDLLLGNESPLNSADKVMLRVILSDPANFITSNGHPQLSALARHFHFNPTSTRTRWQTILRKVAAWQPSSPQPPEPTILF
jgi:hypothetical protein